MYKGRKRIQLNSTNHACVMLWISNLLGGCKYKIFCIYIQSVNSKWTTWHSITMWILKSNSRSAPSFIRNVETWSTSYVGLKKTLNLNHILCRVRLNLAQFSSGNQLIIPVMHFSLHFSSPPLKMTVHLALYLNNLEYPIAKHVFAKLDWNWQRCAKVKKYYKTHQRIFAFLPSSPLRNTSEPLFE